jgi:hypothetical protein
MYPHKPSLLHSWGGQSWSCKSPVFQQLVFCLHDESEISFFALPPNDEPSLLLLFIPWTQFSMKCSYHKPSLFTLLIINKQPVGGVWAIFFFSGGAERWGGMEELPDSSALVASISTYLYPLAQFVFRISRDASSNLRTKWPKKIK